MPEDYLKSLIELSTEIFKNAVTVKVDPEESWNEDFFKKQWFKDTNNNKRYITQSPGWYWIGCDIGFEELQEMQLLKEKELPKSACEISELSLKNYRTFGEDYLCKLDVNGTRIIYNGHQGSVITRIRQHFTLNNENTGALGLKYYPLSQKKWVIRYFGNSHIDRLPSHIQSDVKSIISTQSGRIAIENAWRAKHGWPILCKA
tara:strand:+ start:9428 stop:10036 length:609 start_codon:yes stop_codon:yes gene_type:complete